MKFLVRASATTYENFVVEAKDRETAEEIGLEMACNSDELSFGDEIEIYDVERVVL